MLIVIYHFYFFFGFD